MKIAYLHYHLQPGGVTTVIREQIQAVRSRCDVLAVAGGDPPSSFPAPVEMVPSVGYDVRGLDPPAPEQTAAEVLRAISRRWPEGCDILHVHNPTLAKNRHFLDILAALQESGTRLFLQIHDFAEDGRPNAYFQQPYPADCHYGVINRRDRGILLRAGLQPEGLHWVPNIVRPLPRHRGPSRPTEGILYPVRAIRRKNLGEAVLLSLLLRGRSGLTITLPPNSRVDRESYADWKRFARVQDLDIQFEAGLHHDFMDLVHLASSIVTTSISEGFGFAFVQPWTAGKMLWGRRIPDICPDFEERGIRLDHLYERLAVPLGWIDAPAFSRRWKQTVRRCASRFGYPLPETAIEEGWRRISADGWIDFGCLDEPEQQTVIGERKSDPELRRKLAAGNPWIDDLQERIQDVDRMESNRSVAMTAFTPEEIGRILMDAYRSIASTPIRHAIDKKKLWEAFFSLDRFSLLQWGDYHGSGGRFGRDVPLVPKPTGVHPKGTLPRLPSTVLFDLYGTLFISESGDIGNLDRRSRSAARLSPLLNRFNVQEPPDTVISRFLEAIRSQHRRSRAAGIDHPEVEIDRVWMDVLKARSIDAARRFAEAFENAVNPVWPMPNLEAVLRQCRTRKIRMGIVSNAQFFTLGLFEKFLERSVDELGFDPHLVLLSYRFGRAKPSLSLYRTASRRVRETGGDAEKVLFVGNDMGNDISPAKRVGFMTALFAGDERSLRLRKDDPACEGVEPDIVVTDLIQLLDHFGPPRDHSSSDSAGKIEGKTLQVPLAGQRKRKDDPK